MGLGSESELQCTPGVRTPAASSILEDHGEAPLQRGEHARIWHHDELNGVELFRGHYRKHEFARHFHAVPAIGVVDRGAMRTYCRSAEHHLPAGSVLLLNPGEVHAPGPTGEKGWSFRMFYFSAPVFHERASQVSRKPLHFARPVVQDRSLAQSLLRLHKGLEASTTALETDSTLMEVFAHLAENHAAESGASRSRSAKSAVQRAKEYLAECYQQNVSLAELAEVAQVSQFHLVRAFHREVGLPPHSYLIQMRIEAAKRLLRSGKAIADVAGLAGFTDQSHLTRHFKRWTGVTPNQYRPRVA